jgi:hypothetical protein
MGSDPLAARNLLSSNAGIAVRRKSIIFEQADD